MYPTLSATPSVALSAQDRAFVLQRREAAITQRAEKLRARVFRVSAAVAVAAWSYNIITLWGAL